MTKPEPPPHLPGYEHRRFLGSGGYADVHLYRQLSPEREVAVKVLKSAGLTDAIRRQFAVEANAMAGLGRHPNIVQIFEVAESADGRPYLTMEFYPGDNLGDHVGTRGRLPVGEVLRIGIQIAGAMQTAHLAGLLHRDIKPANILVSVADEPGLSDFGIAGRGTDDEDDLGVSIPWSPPEVLSGDSNGTARSDVYSLAATLWHLLVGRSPFTVPGGDNRPQGLMQRILAGPPAPPTGRADVPASLERLLQQSMARQARLRPATARDLARALQAVEQELRLPRTKDIVLGESPAPAARTPTAGAEATMLRAAQRVQAQPSRPRGGAPEPTVRRKSAPPVPTAVASAHGPPAWTAGRVPQAAHPEPPRFGLPAEAPAAGTVLRPQRPTAAPEPVAVADTEGRRGLRRAHVISMAAAVLVLAAGIGLVLGFTRATPPGDPAAVPSDRATDQVAVDPSTPGIPVISVRRSGGSYRFSWTADPKPAAADTYIWRSTRDNRGGPVSAAFLLLPARGQVCIQVAVRRPGSPIGPTWSDEMCGR